LSSNAPARVDDSPDWSGGAGGGGATYQGLFRNPLADPYLIGWAQGASLGRSLAFCCLFLESSRIRTDAPTIGFCRRGAEPQPSCYLLAEGREDSAGDHPDTGRGSAERPAVSSIVSFLIISSGKSTRHHFLADGQFHHEPVVGSQDSAALRGSRDRSSLCIFARLLNVMQLDEEQAQQLGINVERLKIILLAASTLITAARWLSWGR